jgi:hypothetical protein
MNCRSDNKRRKGASSHHERQEGRTTMFSAGVRLDGDTDGEAEVDVALKETVGWSPIVSRTGDNG